MSKKQVFMSVITPTLNSEKFIWQCLLSVHNQANISNIIEHIIIDGGSCDKTFEIIDNFIKIFCVKNIKILLQNKQNKGISGAFNIGIENANGQIIGILNSDDYYEQNILSQIIEFYKKNRKLDFILHGNIILFDNKKFYLKTKRHLAKYFFYLDLPYYHPSVFVPKKIYEKIGNFNLNYKIAMDYDFLLRASLKNIKFKYLPKTITYFRLGGTANKNAVLCHKEVLKSQITNGLNKIICNFTYLSKLLVNYLKKIFEDFL